MTVGSKTATYAYDADGIRTQKTVDGVTHTYYTLNGKLMRESFPYNGSTFIMDFIYDESGKPFALSYSSNGGESFYVYYYGVNAQGDVEKIFGFTTNEETGEEEEYIYGYYTYDAWGNVTAHTRSGGTPSTTSIVYRNPIRYRGYVYDNETGWYYLQSRYYDPANHRFINADSYASTGQGFTGTNMFAYCNNNPVNYCDESGSYSTYCTTMTDSGGRAPINSVIRPVNSESKELYSRLSALSPDFYFPGRNSGAWTYIEITCSTETRTENSNLDTAAVNIGSNVINAWGTSVLDKHFGETSVGLYAKTAKNVSYSALFAAIFYELAKATLTCPVKKDIPNGTYDVYHITVFDGRSDYERAVADPSTVFERQMTFYYYVGGDYGYYTYGPFYD